MLFRSVLTARKAHELDEAKTHLAALGITAHVYPNDLGAFDTIDPLIETIHAEVGPIDILVTNSGGPRSGPFETLSPADWDDAARVLLTSAVTLTRAVLPGMRARRWGRILTITSIAARQPVDGLMLSNSLRAAVMAFARTLANETAADGVTVNNLMPGYTKTDRVIDLSTQVAARDGVAVSDVYARWEREIPMRRLGEPREFGALAAFLASDLASYITGQSIAVDGGWIRSLV